MRVWDCPPRGIALEVAAMVVVRAGGPRPLTVLARKEAGERAWWRGTPEGGGEAGGKEIRRGTRGAVGFRRRSNGRGSDG